MVENKLVSFVIIVTLWTLVTLLIKVFPFWLLCYESKAIFVKQVFSWSPNWQDQYSFRKIFILVNTETLVAENNIS